MIYVFELGLLALAVLVAMYQSWLIDNGEHIYHGAWFAVWCALTGLSMWALWPELNQPPVWAEEMPDYLVPVAYAIACGCGHLVVFNVCLNRFRGLKWTYTSITTGSLLDRLELRLFGSRVWVMELVVGVIFLLLQFFFI
jgi:hypothetical protein